MSEKARIRIKEVTGKMAEDGRPRYTIYDSRNNIYSSRKKELGILAKNLEGKLAEVAFIKNGKFKNLVSIVAISEEEEKAAKSEFKPRNDDKNREGMSFGNARACAATVIAALIGSGYYGDLSTKAGKGDFDLAEVVEDHTECTKLIEASRPGAELVLEGKPTEEKENVFGGDEPENPDGVDGDPALFD